MRTRLIIISILVTLAAVRCSAAVSLILPVKSGYSGTQVTVPVKVKNFTSMISAQGTIQWNTSIVTFVSVQQYGLSGMSAGSFGTSQTGSGKLAFSWYDGSLLGQTVPDSAVIFSITFNIVGSGGQSSPLSFIGIPTPLEVVNSSYVAQTVTAVNGSISVINSAQPPDLTLYMDTITRSQGTQVVVSMRAIDFTNINSIQGTVQFNTSVVTFAGVTYFGLPGMSTANFGTSQVGSGKLTFSWNDGTLSGINKADSAALFSMAFNLTGSPGTLTALQFAAAPTPLEVTDSLFHTLNAALIQGRIRISTQPVISGLSVYVDTVTGPSGAQVLVSMHGVHFNNLISAQGTLQFNPAVATFDSVVQFGLPNMAYSNFGTSMTGSGKLMFSWNDPTLAGVSIPDKAIIFKARFNLVGPQGTSTPVSFITTPTPQEYADVNFNTVTATLTPGLINITNSSGITIYDPSVMTYCAGSPISVPYVITGSFITGNTFILQLSDQNGSFASPVNLDTVTGINSGTFNTFLPSPITQGTGYRLRIKASNPSLTSPSNPGNITILNVAGLASKPVGDTLLCLNPANSTYVTSATNATSFVWSLKPSSAGTISGTGNNAVVDWNNAFTGTAYVKVYGVNGICNGPVSDSLKVRILAYPVAPAKPAGDSVLCLNPANSTYTIPAVPGATTYTWTLTPAGAGTITPAGTTATVNWGNAYTGNASVSVAATNSICTGPSSAVRVVQILAYPVAPAKPAGDTLLCVNPANSTYTIPAVPGATAYTWTLTPPAAGVITPSGTTAVVNWDNAYFGNASISVTATNSICTGPSSATRLVTILAYPVSPAAPAGDTVLCQDPANSTFTIVPVPGATGYTWNISPAGAGVLTPAGTTATVNWSQSFTGTATISVSASNSICTGPASPGHMVTILAFPAAPALPIGSVSLCPDPANTLYYVPSVPNATSYQWAMFPAAAGSLNSVATTATVDWNNTYTGQAGIYVYAFNGSCQSGYSDTLIITIANLPGVAATPAGTVDLCAGVLTSVYTTTGAAYATSYQWTLSPSSAGTLSGTGTNVTLTWTPGWTGTAWLKVLGVNSCGTGIYSDSLAITMHPLPAVPTIAIAGAVLTSSSPTGNQWYYEGNPISGATAMVYTALQDGHYFVIVTDSNGCSSSSDTINLLTTGILDIGESATVSVLPNPSDGIFRVSGQDMLTAEIFDLRGALLLRREIGEQETDFVLDLRSYTSGVYLLKITYSQSAQVVRLLVY